MLDVSTTTQASNVTVHVRGRFDFDGHREFRRMVARVLTQPSVEAVRFDLSGVDYMDSSALGMLLLSLDDAKAAGKTLSLSGIESAQWQAFDIANFRTLFAYA
jgi:anti-anti-sigma factor